MLKSSLASYPIQWSPAATLLILVHNVKTLNNTEKNVLIFQNRRKDAEFQCIHLLKLIHALGIIKLWNHGIVGTDLKDYLITSPLPWWGTPSTRSSFPEPCPS